jgi:hypothetical protein
MSASDDPSDIFNSLARNYASRPDIKLDEGFGDGPGMRASGELFAAVSGGELVVHLPPERCAMLVDAGEGRLFEHEGTTHEDWIVAPGVDPAQWLALVTEALGASRG